MNENEVQAGKEMTGNNCKKWTDLFYANRLFSEDTALQYVQPKIGCVALEAEDVNTVRRRWGTPC